MAARTTREVFGRELSFTNPDKVLYPETGFTKGELIAYYEAVAERMVPWLEGRPTTLVRCPDGVDGERFFEKMCPRHRPDWVPTFDVYAAGAKREVRFCRIEEPAALAWTAQLAAIELHPGLQRVSAPRTPTHLVVDLDPGPGTDILDCARVAFAARDRLARVGLECGAKVSGSKGLQVLCPLGAGRPSFDKLREVGLALAEGLAADESLDGLVVTNMRKDLREAKILVDWSQNSDFKTTVCTWSLRARVRPWASVPVAWDELHAAVKAADPERLRFEAPAALRRAEQGDPLAELFAARSQRLCEPEDLGPPGPG